MKAVHASLSPSPSCFSHKAQVLKHGSSSKYYFPSLYIHQITFASPSHSVARLPCSTTATVLTPIYVDLPSLGTTRFHIRSSLSRLALKAKSYEARPDDRTLGVVPFSHLTAEREEAKAVLSLFLRKQGYSSTVASRIVKKSEFFIDHLTSKLQSFYKSWYLVGPISNNNPISVVRSSIIRVDEIFHISLKCSVNGCKKLGTYLVKSPDI